jgi:carbon-monoxide dehydrogenase medium subunit
VPVIHGFDLHRPTTVAEAVDHLASGGVPYCGGTELVMVLRMGLMSPESLVDLKRVQDLAGITDTGEEIRLGARVTHDEAVASALVGRFAPVLRAATAALGNARVRATGTLAGNICFGEPRSDVLTALLAVRARVDLRSATGTRCLPVSEFVEGAFSTVREDEELLESIRIPKGVRAGSYVRFQPAEYPTVSVAAVSDVAGSRLVVGAVGERPEVFEAADLRDLDPEDVAARVDVTEDLNGAEDYKRHVTAVHVRRAILRWQEVAAA